MSANKSLKLIATLSAVLLLFNLSTRLLSSARGHCECATCGASLCKGACDYDCSQCCRCCIYFEVRVGRAAFPSSPLLGRAIDAAGAPSQAAISVPSAADDQRQMYLPEMQANDNNADGSKPGRDKMEAAAAAVVAVNGGGGGSSDGHSQQQLRQSPAGEEEVWPPSSTKALLLHRFLQYLYEPNHEQQ